MFPYPEIGNEELEELKQLVAPVEKFFSEEGERRSGECKSSNNAASAFRKPAAYIIM